MVCDFKAVKEAVGEFLERFDHAMCMNVQDAMFPEMKSRYGERVIGFETMDPTTEVLAKVVHDHLEEQLRDGVARVGGRYPMQPGLRVAKVRVWETSSSWAEYEPRAEVGRHDPLRDGNGAAGYAKDPGHPGRANRSGRHL